MQKHKLKIILLFTIVISLISTTLLTKGTVPVAFSSSETLDVGIDLGSPVSFDYIEKAPFEFSGKISSVNIKLL